MIKIPFLDILSYVGKRRREYDHAYAAVMDSGRWIMGVELEQFESEFASFCGLRHCVGVASGLDALSLALEALGIGAGDKVVVPAHTFIATWLAVTRVGATPVAVEPDRDTYLIDASTVADAIDQNTKAVIAVHLYGNMASIEEIASLCRDRSIHLIEDAAQAHGAMLAGRMAGSFGTAGCFSFYPTKNLGALGDGGAVVTDDALADDVRKLRNYGSTERYLHERLGHNSRLDELQAAFLRVGLRHLQSDNVHRSQLAERYRRNLADIGELRLPAPGPPGSHVWHLFVVRTHRRDELRAHLGQAGCETLIHYPIPVYRQPPYREFGPRGESVTDRVARELLSLPMGLHMTETMIDLVSERVREFFAKR